MNSAAATARAATRATAKARGLATGGVEWAMDMLPLDVARGCSSLDAGGLLVCDETLEIGPGPLSNSLAQDRSPTEQPAAQSEGLTGPAIEIERVDVLDDQAVGEAEPCTDVVDHRPPGLAEGVVGQPVRR